MSRNLEYIANKVLDIFSKLYVKLFVLLRSHKLPIVSPCKSINGRIFYSLDYP
jgi:hypothetical protein